MNDFFFKVELENIDSKVAIIFRAKISEEIVQNQKLVKAIFVYYLIDKIFFY